MEEKMPEEAAKEIRVGDMVRFSEKFRSTEEGGRMIAELGDKPLEVVSVMPTENDEVFKISHDGNFVKTPFPVSPRLHNVWWHSKWLIPV